MQTFETTQYNYKATTTINDLSDDDEPDDVVQEVQLPRKITLFRVVMERKLGIDWEHDEDSQSDVSFVSLQTNQVVDNVYTDVHTEEDQQSASDCHGFSPLPNRKTNLRNSKSMIGYEVAGTNQLSQSSKHNAPLTYRSF